MAILGVWVLQVNMLRVLRTAEIQRSCKQFNSCTDFQRKPPSATALLPVANEGEGAPPASAGGSFCVCVFATVFNCSLLTFDT